MKKKKMLLLNLSCMNKFRLLLILLSCLLLNISYAQSGANGGVQLSEEEKTAFEQQARQLVNFMEFAFNTIGSGKTDYKDKHTIIEQSYLKFFKNEKVQIEDDLVEKRDMVTNKDVQAYLKDIDFFFKTVTFKYTIEEITQEISESGDIYFKIKASRNIKGTALDGKQINDNRPRYIEVNLDPTTRDLKIASVYTTKSNEVQELIAWWNSLTNGWRHYLTGDSKVNDSVYLKDVILIHNDYIIKENIYSAYGDTLAMVDTIMMNESRVLPEVRRILRTDKIDISGVPHIYDLKPLYAFSGLKQLNISKGRVPDLDPIRNLSKLESLIAAGSLINSVEPIRYIPNLRVLDISGTLVRDIKPLESMESLEILNLADSRVDSIGIVKELTKLREINFSGLNIADIQVLGNLKNLEVVELSRLNISSLKGISDLPAIRRLSMDNTMVQDLKEISNLHTLEYLFLENTEVSSLKPLEKLTGLKMVYCDKTKIGRAEAMNFMQVRPSVRVIYESQELMAWWEMLPKEWQNVFSLLVELSEPPTREQLHDVSFLKALDVSGNASISSISPLEKISSLSYLNIAGTKVSDLQPIANLFDMETLILSSTAVDNLNPLSALSRLKEIDFSKCKVTSIEPLLKLPEMKSIIMDSTGVADAGSLSRMKRLEEIYADGVNSVPLHVNRILDSLPDVLIIYRTKYLEDWWNKLPTEWKAIFSSKEKVDEQPDRIQLHKVSYIRRLSLQGAENLSGVVPLTVLTRLEELNISNQQINDLTPLSYISRLKVLDFSNTPVSDISFIVSHKSLKELNCANSPVSDLSPISGLQSLIKLNISGTQVTKLDPVAMCSNLQELDCYNTRINNLKSFDEHKNIKILRVYNTRLSEKKIEKFKSLHPGTEVVFY